MCECVRERERETECVCERVCVRERDRRIDNWLLTPNLCVDVCMKLSTSD